MKLRSMLFWVHLLAGVVAGVVIAVMSLTGALLAFEKQVIAWAEGRNRRVLAAGEDGARLPVQSVLERIQRETGRMPVALTWYRDTGLAVEIVMGREEVLYWDPVSDELRPSRAAGVRKAMAALTSWHRWLGMEGEGRSRGKAITGACNVAFLVLIVTGAVLWWPVRRGGSAWRVRLWFRGGMRGRARDWHWHHVLGLWCGPVLLILSATAVVISYEWASRWVTALGANQTAGPSVLSRPSGGDELVEADARRQWTVDELWARVSGEVPHWTRVMVRFGGNRPGGPRSGGGSSPAERRLEGVVGESGKQSGGRGDLGGSKEEARDGVSTRRDGFVAGGGGGRDGRGGGVMTFTVQERGAWPLFAVVRIQVDSRSGRVESVERHEDQPLGRRLRAWLRYLHTGEALGWPGQLVAMGASLGAVVLVWTGLALSWRRFFGRGVVVGLEGDGAAGSRSVSAPLEGKGPQFTDKESQPTASGRRGGVI